MGDRNKFRVWDNGAAFYVDSIANFYLDRDGRLYRRHNGAKHDMWYEPNVIVEFCTGYKDVCGVLIYAGDIVKWTHILDTRETFTKAVTLDIYDDNEAYIVFEHLGWNAGGDTLPDILNLWDGKIVGDIHLNPELLEQI